MDAVQKANSGTRDADGHGARGLHPVHARACATTRATPKLARPRPLRPQRRPRVDAALRVLHLTGYDLPLDEIKRFRQWGSLTPGHPERSATSRPASRSRPGRSARASPTASAWRWPSASCASATAREVQDHHVFAIVSDGDLWRASPPRPPRWPASSGSAASSTSTTTTTISLDGPTSLSFAARTSTSASRPTAGTCERSTTPTTSTRSRRRSRGRAEDERPTLIRVRSIIGYPAPNKQGTARRTARRSARTRCARPRRRWAGTPTPSSSSPTEVLRGLRRSRARRRGAAPSGRERFAAWRAARRRAAPTSGTRAWSELPAARAGGRARASSWRQGRRSPPAPPASRRWRRSRPASRRWSAAPPTSRVDEDEFPGGETSFTGERRRAQHLLRRARARDGRRRQRHGAARRHRAALRLDVPRSSRTTCAGSIRLSALMGLPVAWVFTHDSRRLGEDGPTHQPVEHLAALRAIPGLTCCGPPTRPRPPRRGGVILEELEGPAVLVAHAARTCRCSIARALGPGGRRGARRVRAARPGDDAGDRRRHRLRGRARAGGRARSSTARGSRRAWCRCPAGSCSRPQDEDYRDDVLPAGAADGLGRGRRHDWAGSGTPTRSVGDRPLRRVRAGRRGARAPRHHRRGGRAGGPRRARRLTLRARAAYPFSGTCRPSFRSPAR